MDKSIWELMTDKELTEKIFDMENEIEALKFSLSQAENEKYKRATQTSSNG